MAKRRVAEEMAGFVKLGAQGKVIESYVEGLKAHKSQADLRGFGDIVVKMKKSTFPLKS